MAAWLAALLGTERAGIDHPVTRELSQDRAAILLKQAYDSIPQSLKNAADRGTVTTEQQCVFGRLLDDMGAGKLSDADIGYLPQLSDPAKALTAIAPPLIALFFLGPHRLFCTQRLARFAAGPWRRSRAGLTLCKFDSASSARPLVQIGEGRTVFVQPPINLAEERALPIGIVFRRADFRPSSGSGVSSAISLRTMRRALRVRLGSTSRGINRVIAQNRRYQISPSAWR